MRQSLSKTFPASIAVLVAVALSLLLVVVTLADQFGVHSLSGYSTAMYAPYGKHPDPGLLYGLLYAVAAIGLVVWALTGLAVRASRRLAPGLVVGAVVVGALLAAPLLAATEYGHRIFPASWGGLALLPAVAGVVAFVLLLRHRAATGRPR